MANILTLGTATLDIINAVESYPHEDDEVRALRQYRYRGGNAANTAVALSQLGHQCHWAGTLANDPDSQLIIRDLRAFHINIEYSEILPSGNVPTSYITLNRSNGSRTIIHYRNLAEYRFTAFKKINLSSFDWVHFEGRNTHQTVQMMQHSKKNHPLLPISLEVEKHRENITPLIALADYIIFSRNYALHAGFDSAEQLLHKFKQQFPLKTLICAWGEAGTTAAKNEQIFHQKAFIPPRVVDTLGAGDVFNAGLIHQFSHRCDVPAALLFACQLAGKKCSVQGLSNLMIP